MKLSKMSVVALSLVLASGVSLKSFAGVRAPDTSSSLEIISPCGNNAPLHEVFLRVNGKVLSVMTRMPDQTHKDVFVHLVTAPDVQNQETRDGSGCIFSINNGVLTD